MTRSDQINELAAALAKAQAEMTGAKKDSTNPHFRSSYADLASVREAAMPALNKHGISVVQFPRLVHAGETGWLVEVETTLLHTSGQWMSDALAVPVTKADAQGVGSCITYARRYALGAVAGIAPEDDDANAAVGLADPARQAMPTGAGADVTIHVADIIKKPSGWIDIKGDDGKKYSTKSAKFEVMAKDARAAGQPLVVTFKNGNYGSRDILDLKESDAVAEPAV